MTNKMNNKEMLINIMNNLESMNKRFDNIESRLENLEKADKKSAKKPTKVGEKGKTSKKADNRTFAEKKAEWASSKFSEAERKAYGEKAAAARKAIREEANKAGKYYSKAQYAKRFKELMAQ